MDAASAQRTPVCFHLKREWSLSGSVISFFSKRERFFSIPLERRTGISVPFKEEMLRAAAAHCSLCSQMCSTLFAGHFGEKCQKKIG